MQKISVAIAEDNVMALKSILKKLSDYININVSLIATNGENLIEDFDKQAIDVVLMDIEMPFLDGIAATQKIKEKYIDVKVVMLTTFDDDEKIFNAILAGASGYLLKDESAEIIYKSIVDVYEGKAAMSATIALKTLNYVKSTAQPSKAKVENILSQREIEILSEIKNGLVYKQIAEKLFISEGTVRKHIENIYRKLQVNNKMNAVNKAIDNKWID